jgi:hypothetical protein
MAMIGPMALVILESPYSGDIDRNIAYARACVRDCLQRNESPAVSHLLFTQPGVLDDNKPHERALGIAAGHAWLRAADKVVVYIDHGVSDGMQHGIDAAAELKLPVERRRLYAEAAE